MSATRWKISVCVMSVVLCVVAGEAPAPPMRSGLPDRPPDGPHRRPPRRPTRRDKDRRRPDQPKQKVEQVNITVSKETTHVLEPLNADGTVNYLAHVNATACKDLRLRDNAATLLLTALGPKLFDRTVRKKALMKVKMNALPARGDYFRTLAVHVKRLEDDEKPSAGDPLAAAEGQLDRAAAGAWSAKRHPLIADWLERNEDALDMVVAATKRRRLYLPVVSPDELPTTLSAKVPNPARLKEVARALIARAMLRADAGEFEDARTDLIAAHKLARLIAQGPTLIEWLTATGIERMACKADRVLAASGKLPADQAQAFLANLNSLAAMPHPREVIGRFERFVTLDEVIEHVRKGLDAEFGKDFAVKMDAKKWADYEIDWDDVLKRFNRFYDRQVEAMGKNTFVERKIALDAFGWEFEGFSKGATKRWKDPKEVAKALKPPESDSRRTDRRQTDNRRRTDDPRRRRFTHRPGGPGLGMPDPGRPRPGGGDSKKTDPEKPAEKPQRKPINQMVGDILLVSVLHSAHKCSVARKSCESHDRAAMELAITRVAMALSAYHATSGQYPRYLSSLSAKFVKGVPRDLFVNGPLRYKASRSGYLLYSVGANMTDDGGRNNKATGDDDISARVK